MAKEKAKLDAGQIITVKGEKFEVIHVSAYTDEDGNPHHFSYELILASEAEEKRQANEKAQAQAIADTVK